MPGRIAPSALRVLAVATLLWGSSSILAAAAAAAERPTDAGSSCPSDDGGSGDGRCAAPKAEAESDRCALYLAFSSVPGAGLGLYTSVDIPEGSTVGGSDPDAGDEDEEDEDRPDHSGDMFVPILDQYKSYPYRGQMRFLPWMSYVWGAERFYHIPWEKLAIDTGLLDSDALTFLDGPYKVRGAFAPGVASLLNDNEALANVAKDNEMREKDGADLHWSRDPGAGGFTQHYGVTFEATRNIEAGSELFLDYGDKWRAKEKLRAKDKDYDDEEEKVAGLNFVKSLEWLEENGFCVDNIRAGPSTIKQAGRGAFAKRFLPAGSLVAPAPLLVLKREDLVMHEADAEQNRYRNVLNKEKVVGRELLLNYCYGHPDSPLLLLPYSPIVNFINHDGKAPNVEIRWPKRPFSHFPDPKEWLNLHPLEVLELSGKLMMDFVALRDIEPGEEIFIDYGRGWEEARERHTKEWKTDPEFEDFVSAEDYLQSDPLIRTKEEQEEDPYPPNLQTVCYFVQGIPEGGCVRPCTIVSRKAEEDGETYFEAYYSKEEHLQYAEHLFLPVGCRLEEDMDDVYTKVLPAEAIGLMEKREASDQLLEGAFRHEIGVPDGFFPAKWSEPAVYEIAPLEAPLKPGDFAQLRWKHNGKPVTQNAHFVGLPPKLTPTVRDFCDRMGITDLYRKLLYEENIPVEYYAYVELQGEKWYAQRPHGGWDSNMHWISPYGESARVSYLRALGQGGMDEILESAGKFLDLEKLTCFHNTFIAVSECDNSLMHTDFRETGNKSFNFVFPLMIVNGSKAELDVESTDGNIVVSVNYEYGVAVNVGDMAWHRTSAIDYRATGEMRMMASVYCSDINEENVASIRQHSYAVEHPAPFSWQFELPVKEIHWDKKGIAHLPT